MPGGYFFKALSQWTDYRTRARRTEFWLFVLVAWLLEVFAVALTATMINSAVDSDAMTVDKNAITTLGWVFVWVTAALWLFFLFPLLAVTVRRMHDLGHSGWWAIFLFVVPIVVWIMALFDGQPMTNRYGGPQGARRGVGRPTDCGVGSVLFPWGGNDSESGGREVGRGTDGARARIDIRGCWAARCCCAATARSQKTWCRTRWSRR